MDNKYVITVDGVPYGGEVNRIPQKAKEDSTYLPSSILSGELDVEHHLEQLPLVPSGSDIKSDDSSIEWIPFPYLFGDHRSNNIYSELASGNITKNSVMPERAYINEAWYYIQRHFDEYAEINVINVLGESRESSKTKDLVSWYPYEELRTKTKEDLQKLYDDKIREISLSFELTSGESNRECFIKDDSTDTVLNFKKIFE